MHLEVYQLGIGRIFHILHIHLNNCKQFREGFASWASWFTSINTILYISRFALAFIYQNIKDKRIITVRIANIVFEAISKIAHTKCSILIWS